jgi:hypothetical protein
MLSREEATAVLGLPRCSPVGGDELRAAYRRASLRAHPDKPGGSREQFYRVRDAYESLQQQQQAQPDARTIIVHRAIDMLRMLMMMYVAWSTQPPPPPPTPRPSPPDIQLDIPVSLEDIFAERAKRVVISVHRGGAMLRETLVVAPRPECYRFVGRGDQFAGGIYGDVSVRVSVAPHPVFATDTTSPFDLHHVVRVTPMDHYFGCARTVDHVDGGPAIEAMYSASSGTVHVERGRGLPRHVDRTRGDLYVFFELEMPELPRSHLEREDVRRAFRKAFMSSNDVDEDALADVDGDADDGGLDDHVCVLEVEGHVLGHDGGDG